MRPTRDNGVGLPDGEVVVVAPARDEVAESMTKTEPDSRRGLVFRWFQEHNRQLLKRLNDLIRDAQRNQFVGIGKPEPLKGELSGHWSRRINTEHRLVYSASDTELTIISCRYHYER